MYTSNDRPDDVARAGFILIDQRLSSRVSEIAPGSIGDQPEFDYSR
jgi:hypothetical protein